MAHVLRTTLPISRKPGTRHVRFEHFSTESYPMLQRHEAWRELLQQHHLRPEGSVDPASMFGTLVAGRTARGVELARIASSPQTLARLGRASHAGSGAMWLSLHQAGEATLFDYERRVEIAPGDIVYGPDTAATGLRFASNFRQFMVLMPRRSLARRPAALPLGVGHLSGRSGMGRMFAGTLNALSESFDTLADDDVAPIESALSEFIASSLVATEPRTTVGNAARTVLNASQAATMARVHQHIETRLSEPGLTLASLAERERVSARLLQKLFEASGSTFSPHLRQRRLERCRADLSNRLYGHLSISDICFRWGFNDSAHFSHAFRDLYQISPRQYRQQAAEATQQSLQKTIRHGWPKGYQEPSADDTEAQAPGTTPATQQAFDVTTGRSVDTFTGGQRASPGVGRHHHLPANDKTIHRGYFSRSIPPVLTIASGDIVTIETLTQHAYDEHDRMIKGDSGAESVFHWTQEHKNVDRRGAGPVDASIFGRGSGEGFGVHICTGPVYVQDAAPGDVLEVRILDLLPRLSANARYEGRAFGSNAAAWWGFHYDDLLTEPKPREVVTIYEIDAGDGGCGGGGCAHAVYNFRWTPQRDPNGVLHPTIDYPGIPVDRSSIVENHGVLKNVRIPTRPHFGVIAVAPVEAGLVDSIPPAYFGGNIDNWRIAKGATVYLRVGVDGGLLSVGDPHASQGDSELCGTAIECSLTGVFQIVLHKAKDLGDAPYADIDYPLVETADEWVLRLQSPQLPEGTRRQGAQRNLREIIPRSGDARRLSQDAALPDDGQGVERGRSDLADVGGGGFRCNAGGRRQLGVHAVIRKALFTDGG